MDKTKEYIKNTGINHPYALWKQKSRTDFKSGKQRLESPADTLAVLLYPVRNPGKKRHSLKDSFSPPRISNVLLLATMKKNSFFLPFCFSLLALTTAGTAFSQQNIIPRPAQLTVEEGAPFLLDRDTALFCESDDPAFLKETNKLRDFLNRGTRLNLSNYKQAKNSLVIRQDKSLADKGE